MTSELTGARGSLETADGAVVWVVSDGGRRQLFHVADGFELSVADPEGANHADN